MPAIGTGRENTSAAGQAKGRRKKKYVPVTKSPVGDQHPQQGIAQANKFKASSPKYAASVRAGYRAGSTSSRQRQVAQAQTKQRQASYRAKAGLSSPYSTEEKAILEAHRQRHVYDLQKLLSIGFLPRVRYQTYKDKYDRDKLAASMVAAGAGDPNAFDKQTPVQKRKTVADAVKISKSGKSYDAGVLGHLIGGAPAGIANRAGAIIEATYHDPLGVPLKTSKQAVLAVPAALGGVVEGIQHPIATTSAMAKDFAKRNTEDYSAKVKRIRKEGAFADAADLATVATLSGGATSAAARAALVRKVGERAAVRITGDIVKERHRGGVTRTVAGRLIDNARGRKLEKELTVAEAGGRPMEAVRQIAAKTNRAAGRTEEIVPRFVKAAQRRAIATERGKSTYRFKADQKQRLREVDAATNRLSKKERRAFWYATALGIRHSTPLENKVAVLTNLRDDIVQGRASAGLANLPGSLKKSDMLPDLNAILANPDAHFTPHLSETVEGLRPASLRAAIEDPRYTPGQLNERRWAPVAAALRLHPGDAPDVKPVISAHDVAAGKLPELAKAAEETRPKYRARVATKAAEGGLAKPIYFKSERYVGPADFGSRALGGGKFGAMADDFRYRGGNLRVGLQDTSTAQFSRGLARNIKAVHNWDTVQRMAEDHVIPGLSSPKGTTISDLRERLAKAGIDSNSVAFWNPTIFRKAARDAETSDSVAAASEDLAGETTAVGEALKDSVHFPGRKGQGELARSSGWHAVPVEVMRELERQSTPSRPSARVWDIAKGKASRAILLTGNVPWATFQVASNVAVSAAATGGRALNPANWVGAAKWWHEMSAADRHRVGAEIGLDTAGAEYAKTHLGASTNNNLVNTYRAIKAHPFWHTETPALRVDRGGVRLERHGGLTISQLNPLERMAAFDRTQNNAARIVTAFSKMKPEAVRSMGDSMARADKYQQHIVGALSKKDVRDQVTELAKDPVALEKHAAAVNDWLGDYTSMTSFERNTVNRLVMFYPYLRYSLRLVFYTLPVKHPIVTSIIAELGQMRAEELKKLLGGDRLYYDVGKVYFGKGDSVKEIDLRRANPALNALWDVAGTGNSGQALGVLPPYAQWAVDQLTHRSTYADREWRVEGKAAGYGVKGQKYGNALRAFQPGSTRNRVLLQSLAKMTYPYRMATDRSDAMQGVQGDDSLLWSPRPVSFKGKTYVSKLKEAASKKQEAFDKANRRSILETAIPFMPTRSRDFESADEQKAIAYAEAHPPKRKKKAKKYLGGGMGGSVGMGG